MKKTRVLLYEEPGKAVFVEEDRKQPDAGQVGVEIIASSLCNTSELRSFKGGYETGYGVDYPMKPGEPGHEAVGVVSEIGKGSTGFKKGDYVVMTGHGGDPCHRSHVTRDHRDIAAIRPYERDPAEAAVLEMYGCAWHCAITPFSKDYYKGKKVMVQGMGAMGLCTIQVLKAYGAGGITAVDPSEERLDVAVKCGTDIAIKPVKINMDEKFDVIIECSGSSRGQETACALAPPVLIFSSYNTNEIRVRQNRWFDANTTIYNPGIVTTQSFKAVAELYNERKIDPSLLISGRIRPEKEAYLQAIEGIKDGKMIKVLMEWG